MKETNPGPPGHSMPEGFSDQKPENYLKAKIEPELPAGERRNLERRHESILDVPVSCDYSAPGGFFESNPSLSRVLSFFYQNIPEEEVSLMAEEVIPIVAKKNKAMSETLQKFLVPGLVSIDSLVLRDQESGEFLDVSGDVKSHKIDHLLLQPNSQTTHAWVVSGGILTAGNPWELATLLNIYHEINHPDTPQRDEPITTNEASSDLKAERDAWAFALLKLKPFLSKKQRGFAKSYIHEALGSHSDSLREV